MCGICGVISADPRPVEPAVRAMMRAMVHRGPDDEGFELLPMGQGDALSPVVGLGFRRLSILDLSSAGHQPMFNERTGDCLVFNGEIYNFRQLRAELQCAGVRFRSQSDTEVLLQAISSWGDAAVERLEGMYAFAFYHAESRRVLLARDPLGIKPLYVAAGPAGVVFASEIRALLSSGLVARDLDPAGVAGMLAFGAIQSPRTIYESIRQFPAGHVEWFGADPGAGGPISLPRRFWTYPTKMVVDRRQLAAERVRQLMRRSVERHLVADVPVGVFLSAGIDSSIVASYAKQFSSNVVAFTVGFGSDHGDDEVTIAASTARALGIKHVAVSVDELNLPAKWHDWLLSMDSPSVDGFNTYVVSRRLAQEGVVVGLSGLGADELFGGYPTFKRAPELMSLLWALRVMPPPIRGGVVARIGGITGNDAAAEKLADLASGNLSVAGIARSLRRTLSNARLGSMGFSQSRMRLDRDYLDPRAIDFGEIDAFNIVARVEAESYMRDTLLRDTDINSMRHSLEVRVPFLDLPLVDYVSSLPGHVKYGRGLQAKLLLREAALEVLPSAVAIRKKTGFSLPIGTWMRGAMRESCEAGLQRACQIPFIRADAAQQIWVEFLGSPESMHWSRPLAIIALGSCLASQECVV
jgi:asparagine synthase (glutamine-hydrolysing)